MFNFLKGKNKVNSSDSHENKNTDIYAPVNGELILIEEVNDEVFSKKLLGDGFAIIPDNDEIYSPVSGKINNIFPTKHAFGIQTSKSDEIILHIGIDTVELNGEPFSVFVKEGDVVTPETLIAKMDNEKLKGKDPTVIIAFTNQDTIENIILKEKGQVNHGEEVGKVVHK